MIDISKKIPLESQVLIYPMKSCTIAAGFKNTEYAKDPAHRFTHFGMDCDSFGATNFEVIASGKGTVLGIERNQNALGCVVVVKYPKVYIPKTGSVKDLIVRYIHMESIKVISGSTVSAYSVIGIVSDKHKWWNHIHVEIDSDTTHPFHTPQVAESSSSMLIRAGANDSTMIDPADVFVIGKNQKAIVHPLAIYVDAKDIPRYKEKDFVRAAVTTEDYQKLILPINNMRVTAGYKNAKYSQLVLNGLRMGTHYGLDCVGSSTIYASGNGTVLLAGKDSVLGNVVAVKYENAYNHKTGKSGAVVLRYHHLASIGVKVGNKVTKDTKIGIMGATGKYTAGVHLHLEADSDATHYQYTPTLSVNTNLMKAGTRGEGDTTFNPAEVLYCKTDAPDSQTITRTMDGYTSKEDIDIIEI